MEKIPTQEQNPEGLHQRFLLQKIVLKENSFMGIKDENSYELNPVDKDAEYFVLRLDERGKDINHIKACRIGIHAYADAIDATIPQLAKDLKERYPLL